MQNPSNTNRRTRNPRLRRTRRTRIRTLTSTALAVIALAVMTGCNAGAGFGAQALSPAALLDTPSGTTGLAVDYDGQFGGGATIELLDADDNSTVAMVETDAGEIARFADLSAGTYLVVVHEVTDTLEPSSGTAVSSSFLMMSDAIDVSEGKMVTLNCTTEGCD